MMISHLLTTLNPPFTLQEKGGFEWGNKIN